MSPMNVTETFDKALPMVSLLSVVNMLLSVLPLIISIITLVLVIKIYRRK